MAKTTPPLPLPIQRALRKLGTDIRDARRRRGLAATVVAERALITRVTLRKVERGDPGVSLGIYATVLWVLGLGDRVGELADPGSDVVGLTLDAQRLPQRVRPSRTNTRHSESES